jgi:inosine-uridine nucleoside N-ribohydrolase
MKQIPLIIDTDVALGAWHEGRPRDIDDGLAIVEALNVPQIKLLGVTTVY